MTPVPSPHEATLVRMREQLLQWWSSYRKPFALLLLREEEHLKKIDQALLTVLKPQAKAIPGVLSLFANHLTDWFDPRGEKDWWLESHYAEALLVYRVRESDFLLEQHRFHQQKPIPRLMTLVSPEGRKTVDRKYPLYAFEIECELTNADQAMRRYRWECQQRGLAK